MGVDCTKTLASILKGGEYVGLRREFLPENKVSLIFYRTIDATTRQEYLVATEWRKLSFFQKVKYFFRTSDFSLQTINRLAEAALKEKGAIGNILQKRPEKRYYFSIGLSFLQEKIESANRPKWIRKLFFRSFSPINMQAIKHAFLQLTSPPGGKKKRQKVFRKGPPAQTEKTKKTEVIVTPIGRGLYNPKNLCYCNSTIKAIWGSPALREVVSRSETKVAQLLMAVLNELDKKGPMLLHEEEPMKSFLDAFKERVPQWKEWLSDIHTQRDQQELLLPLLGEILPGANRKGVVIMEVNTREKLQGQEGAGPMALIQRAYIPVFDSKNRSPERGPMMFFHPKADGSDQDIKDLFSSTVKDNIELESFIDLPENHFTEAEKQLLRDTVGKNKAISSIPISRSHVLVGEPPPCLPIYVARFASERAEGARAAKTYKNRSIVRAPFTLEVPVDNPRKPSAKYELKGIVCHSGSTLSGGHYYNYFPLSGSPCDKEGRPIYWMQHSDSYVSEKPVEWSSIEKQIEFNATLYMYDRR